IEDFTGGNPDRCLICGIPDMKMRYVVLFVIHPGHHHGDTVENGKRGHKILLAKIWDCFFKESQRPGFYISKRLSIVIFTVLNPQFGLMDQLMKYLVIVWRFL